MYVEKKGCEFCISDLQCHLHALIAICYYHKNTSLQSRYQSGFIFKAFPPVFIPFYVEGIQGCR